jgi:hypothetical protein
MFSRSNHWSLVATASIASALFGATALANDELVKCRKIADSAARLACYDGIKVDVKVDAKVDAKAAPTASASASVATATAPIRPRVSAWSNALPATNLKSSKAASLVRLRAGGRVRGSHSRMAKFGKYKMTRAACLT